MRLTLVVLIVLATAGFVVGTSIERHDEHHESPSAVRAESTAGGNAAGDRRDAVEKGDAEGSGEPADADGDKGHAGAAAHEESRPLGIDIEATPFVVLAAVVSLALAAAAWTRPRWLPVLGLVAIAMLLFGLADIREVLHQRDEGRAGLEVLAGVIAVAHLGAATLAVVMWRRSRGRIAAMAAQA